MNGDTNEQRALRALRMCAAAFRCEWPRGFGVADALVVGPEFFLDAVEFPAEEVVVIHSLPIGGVHHCVGGPVGEFLRVTRTA